MAVALDADFLLLLLDPDANPPNDPATQKSLERAKDRVEYLVRQLGDSKTKIVLPTPVLSEILIRAGRAGPSYIDILRQHAQFKIAPFDERAAIECAAKLADARNLGDKKAGSTASWAKVKFDRQIVAIAVVNGVEKIYSSDEDIEKYAKSSGIVVTKLWKLPLPPAEQPSLPHIEPSEGTGASGTAAESGRSDSGDSTDIGDGE